MPPSRWRILWKLRVPASFPYLFTALKIAAPAAVVGAIIGELPVVDPGRSRRGDPQLQPVLRHLAAEPVGDEHHRGRARDPLLRGRRGRREARSSAALRRTSHERDAAAVSVKGLSKRFERGDVLALEDIDLDVQPGEFVSLIGPSGCGKSTLLRIIGDLIQPTEGDVLVNGKSAQEARRRPRLRDRLPGRRPLRLAQRREEHRAAARDGRLGQAPPRGAGPARCSSSSS